MGVTTTSSIAKFLYPGLAGIFNDNYSSYPTAYTKIFTRVTSDKLYEERAGFVGLGLARKKESGQNVYMDAFSQGFVRRTTNDTYALGYKITMEAVEDNQYPQISLKNTKHLARALQLSKEYNGALMLDRAFNSSYTFADGVEMCATTHTTKTGLTFSNELATAADLSEAALEQLMIDIGGATDERGLLIGLRGKTIVVPNALQFEIERILNSTLRPGTSDNDINVLNRRSLNVVVNPYLTDPDAWFVLTDLPGEDGLIEQVRQAPRFDNETEFSSKDMVFSVYERYKFDCVDVRSVYGSPGA
jgi:phage major head subunit gpT-like protein